MEDIKITESSSRIEKILGRITGDWDGEIDPKMSNVEILLDKVKDTKLIKENVQLNTNYNFLSNKPKINGVVLTPTTTSAELQLNGLDSYSDLKNKPKINGKTLEGDLTLTINGELITDHTSLTINYKDIKDTPVIPEFIPQDFNYNHLTNLPTINGVPVQNEVTIPTSRVTVLHSGNIGGDAVTNSETYQIPLSEPYTNFDYLEFLCFSRKDNRIRMYDYRFSTELIKKAIDFSLTNGQHIELVENNDNNSSIKFGIGVNDDNVSTTLLSVSLLQLTIFKVQGIKI